MSDIPFDGINIFLERVRSATRSKSKEIRIGITEAEDVALTITQVIAREATSQQQIINLQQQIIELQQKFGMNNIEITGDGGSF